MYNYQYGIIADFVKKWYNLILEGVDLMPVTIAKIKTKLDDRIGNNLTVTTQVGRKKVTTRHGILRETFPAVFVVDLDQDENAVKRVSFSYTDVLTRNIELNFDND